MAENRKRKFWGWGYEDQGPTPEQQKHMAERMAKRFGLGPLELTPPPKESELNLRAPRVKPPAALEAICSTATHERAGHTYGKGSRDIRRAFRRDYPNPIDVVAFPRDEKELIRVLEWCDGAQIAAVPYGGGSSVVGGVEPPEGDRYRGAVSIDLMHLDKVVEVDKVSRAARIQARRLRPRARRAVEAARLDDSPFSAVVRILDAGRMDRDAIGWAFRDALHAYRRLRRIAARGDADRNRRVATLARIGRGSESGPDVHRLRGNSRNHHRGVDAVAGSSDVSRGRVGAVSEHLQGGAMRSVRFRRPGFIPRIAACSIEGEAFNSGAGNGDEAVLVLAFESADHPLEPWMKRALECCADHGGKIPADAAKTRTDAEATHEGSAGAWRNAFLNAPYLMDTVAAMGMVSDTFETSITWERFPEFHRQMMETAREVITRVCGKGSVTCRFTHVYPDGPAPYYTILAPGKRGSELEQWDEIKAAVSDKLIALGGTITHHHAVGRYHRPWYDRQRPDGFALALKAAKKALDPRSILNPGVLIDPD